jgi:hypothetical protein
VALGVLASLALAPTAAAATVSSPNAAASSNVAAQRNVTLSNETTFTTWSVADRIVPIRSRPAPSGRAIARLQYGTPDGFQETYILLREHFSNRTPWILVRIPGRPNGRTGWVPRSALDSFHLIHTEIVVDRETTQLTLYRNGRAVYKAPVGVGKPSTPTPAGHYWITESFPSTDPFYGPWAFGTADYSTLATWANDGVVGLHGTNEPWLIPGYPSHGCIRLHNSDIAALSHRVPIGTPLLVI